jgi:glycerol-1-phosphate dehydrogenase [NAD(P)+]
MKALLEQRWTEIRRDLIAIAMPLDALGAAFATAGVAIKPDMLGMSTVDYRDAVRYARDLRDRFTMLDLAGDAGLLNAFITKHLEK